MSEQQKRGANPPTESSSDAVRHNDDSVVSDSVARALELARERQLDRSLRNKLLNTPLSSSRARQIRVFDNTSDHVFAQLRSKKKFTFLPSPQDETADAQSASDDDFAALNEAIDSARTRDSHLRTRLTSNALHKQLLSLFYEGHTLEEEQGVNILFLALGFLTWRESPDSELDRHAPLVLLPVELVRDGSRDRFRLKVRDEDLIANVSLQAWLKDTSGIELPDLPDSEEWQPSAYCEAVSRAIRGKQGWRVHTDDILLAFFSFSKFLMWRDLSPNTWGAQSAQLLENPLLKTILLRGAFDELSQDSSLITETDTLDEAISPVDLVHVTDADSSQAIAIQEVMAGKNLVIQGPPGTGKSQTITNIIAGAAQRGQRVLFIAEKMAALNVVHDRLKSKNLEALCLELHSRKSSKTQVLAQIRQAYAATTPETWSDAVFAELRETQTRLRDHSNRLHLTARGTISAFQLIGHISLLKARGVPTPDFALHLPETVSIDDITRLSKEAERIAGIISVIGIPASHPWKGVRISTPDMLAVGHLQRQVQRCKEALTTLIDCVGIVGPYLIAETDATLSRLRAWENALAVIATRPTSFDDLRTHRGTLDSLDALEALSDRGAAYLTCDHISTQSFQHEAFTCDWSDTRAVLRHFDSSWYRALIPSYRHAVRMLRRFWKGVFPRDRQERLSTLDALIERQRLDAELQNHGETFGRLLGSHWNGSHTDWRALTRLVEWLRQAKTLEGSLSVVTPERLLDPQKAAAHRERLTTALASATATIDALSLALALDSSVAFASRSLADISLSSLHQAVQRWDESLGALPDWTAARDGLQWLRDNGASELADRLYDGRVPAHHLHDSFMLAIYECLWKRIHSEHPEIGQTRGDLLNQLVTRFRKADLDRIEIASRQTRRTHITQKPIGWSGAAGELRNELNKKHNIKPVRKLMSEAGEAVQKLKPVFLMSPLSVAQYLPPGALQFDLLVIDEASQVRPEDALGAIARCRQVVVVGDDKQLPPTNFFSSLVNAEESGDDEQEESSDSTVRINRVQDVESVLQICARFPSRMLKWHYRSEHPALIATSNRLFYGGELMLPPSVVANTSDGHTGLLFHTVPRGGYERGKTARNEIEADLIAKATLQHARNHPDLSLGVGTFSTAQRDCVRDCIETLARKHAELDEFIKGTHGREPLFVKNLENIQGDERDVIFVSVGYGYDANGKLTQQFGPIGRDGGERRLNVLITRARKRCEVFSSIVAEDIRSDGAETLGIRALREFLKLARDGYSALPQKTRKDYESPFEEAVATVIRGLGHTVEPQVGMAGFFIDLAVVDPNHAGRYVLGVECDGAAYHSSRFARDRDRLRQDILESRGWRIHRIWSSDWFYQPERERVKLKAAIDEAIARASATASERHIERQSDEVVSSEDNTVAPSDRSTVSSPEVPVIDQDPSLPGYVHAEFRIRPTPILPQELPTHELAHWASKIVEIEQPIHVEEVARRLAQCCGKQRAGRQIVSATTLGLELARQAGRVAVDADFWTMAGQQPLIARDRSALPTDDSVRKPEMIAPVEFEAAALIALDRNIAMSEDDLLTATARLLGFARVGPDLRQAITGVITTRLDSRVERDHLGRVRRLKIN